MYPNRPVVILYGDGSCGFSIVEFDTFARYKMSVIAFIGNDACWSQIAREQVALFKSSVAVDLVVSSANEIFASFKEFNFHISKKCTDMR